MGGGTIQSITGISPIVEEVNTVAQGLSKTFVLSSLDKERKYEILEMQACKALEKTTRT